MGWTYSNPDGEIIIRDGEAIEPIYPKPSLKVGQRVVTRNRNFNPYHPGGLAPGLVGTVVGYATPEIAKRQVWDWESYYVEFDSPFKQGRFVVDLHDHTGAYLEAI